MFITNNLLAGSIETILYHQNAKSAVRYSLFAVMSLVTRACVAYHVTTTPAGNLTAHVRSFKGHP